MRDNLLRSFGRDPQGDSYGRHALVNPGGDNRQTDVIRLVGSEGIDLNHVSLTYVGAHRVSWFDAQIDHADYAEWVSL